jgi:hypothetical protein
MKAAAISGQRQKTAAGYSGRLQRQRAGAVSRFSSGGKATSGWLQLNLTLQRIYHPLFSRLPETMSWTLGTGNWLLVTGLAGGACILTKDSV